MSTFFSKWLRSSSIKRWPLQVNLIGFNNAEHSFECALIAHLIGTIENVIFNGDVNPDRMAAMAIYHEADETRLGDVNTIAKNHDPETKAAFKRLSNIFECDLLESLPSELIPHYKGYIIQDKESLEGQLCKASDDISAYIEASKELALGNYEFADSVPNCLQKVNQWRKSFESIEYFCTTFLPQINQTIEKDFR